MRDAADQNPKRFVMRRMLLSLFLGLLLLFAVRALLSFAAPAALLRTLHSGYQFLPPYASPRDRFGFDSGRDLASYAVDQLHAGWYSDWHTNLDPPHPDGLTYVQLVLFQAGADPNDPSQFTMSPSSEMIARIAATHPGSLWLLGNEPDSQNWGSPIGPEVYAIVYHDYHALIKHLDPTALIANGSIVQPTPCRLEYLDIVWETYQQTYSETMPVDVWNVHAFILREVGAWGAGPPPGVDPICGMDYRVRDGDDVDIFRDNLVAMRQWMKDKGEQNKPLIISEYGVLWPEWYPDEDGRLFTPERVSHFMTQTFDLFLNETYPDVGYPEDDHRLVQAWAWYSLSDDRTYNGYLFHSDSKEISTIGQAYADYTAALADTAYADLVAQLWVDMTPLGHLTPTVPFDVLTSTLPVTGTVANLGQISVTDVVIAAPLLGFRLVQDMPARYEEDVAPLLLPELVITGSGVYDLSLFVDPAQAVTDVHRANNAYTVSVDARPDLLISATVWSMHTPGGLGHMLDITLTVANRGAWPSRPVSGALGVNNAHGTLILPAQRFSVPALASVAQANVTQELLVPASNEDLYRLRLEVDSADMLHPDGVLDEQDEDNNQVEVVIPIVVTTTLEPGSTAVLTSTSGHLTFLLPAGTVTRTTEIRLTPRVISELDPGSLAGVAAFELAAYQDGQPILITPLLPITVTWQYTDADVSSLDEDSLDLYYTGESQRWQRVVCPAQRREPELNRLSICIQELGTYVFGQEYFWFVPYVLVDSEGGQTMSRVEVILEDSSRYLISP
jgi:hypothetical protein